LKNELASHTIMWQCIYGLNLALPHHPVTCQLLNQLDTLAKISLKYNGGKNFWNFKNM